MQINVLSILLLVVIYINMVITSLFVPNTCQILQIRGLGGIGRNRQLRIAKCDVD